MDTFIGKWGNSLAMRIPQAMAKELDLSEGVAVELVVHEGSLVVRPQVRAPRLRDELISKITAANRHEAFDLGAPVGHEEW